MNAVIQAICSVDAARKAFIDCHRDSNLAHAIEQHSFFDRTPTSFLKSKLGSSGQDTSDVATELCALLVAMGADRGGRVGYLRPAALLRAIRSEVPALSSSGQHDAEELFLALFGCADEAARFEGRSPARLFRVQLVETKRCLGCGLERGAMAHALTLHVHADAHRRGVEQLLAQEYAAPPGALDGFRCSACGQPGTTALERRILSVPPVLVLCVERFRFSASRGGVAKIHGAVSFPEVLGGDSLRACFHARPAAGPPLVPDYYLWAVVVHIGRSARKGHYITLRRLPGTASNWLVLDDDRVSLVTSFYEIQQRAFGEGVRVPTAYLLFYSVQPHHTGAGSKTS